MAWCPGLGAHESDGIVVMERGYMVERRVGIELECSGIVWSGVVIWVLLDIVVGGSLLGMAWFAGWKGRLVLHGIV